MQLTVGSGVHLGEDLARGIVRAKCLSVLVNGVEVIDQEVRLAPIEKFRWQVAQVSEGYCPNIHNYG